MMMIKQFLTLLVLVSVSAHSALAEEKKEVPTDPVTGMKVAEGWELVRVHCTVCHSPQQFLQQKGTQSTWTDIIRWMQKSGGLWQFDADTESKIISYLANNYGPDGAFRRAPIPGSLLPENPYQTGAKQEFEEKKKAGEVPVKAP